MKPTFYDFRSLMKIFMPKYDEQLERKLNLPENVRVIVDAGNYQLLDIKKNSMKKLIKSKIKIESIKENNNAFFIRLRYFFLNPSHLLSLKLSISSGIATVKIPKIAMFPKPITIL